MEKKKTKLLRDKSGRFVSPKKETKEPASRVAALSRKIIAPQQEQINIEIEEKKEEIPQQEGMLKEAEKTQNIEQSSQKEGGETSNELILGKFKSVKDLEKSYREIEKAFTRVNQEKAEQERFYKELLKAIPTKTSTPQIDIAEDFYEKLQDNPKEAVKEIISIVEQNLEKKNEEKRKLEEQAKFESSKEYVTKYLHETYPDIVKPENYAFLDHLASLNPSGDLKSRYEYAVSEFKKFRQRLIDEVKPQATKEVAQVEEMKRKAKLESSSPRPSKKIYSREKIIQLMIHQPEEYKLREKEIMQAYREGRVR